MNGIENPNLPRSETVAFEISGGKVVEWGHSYHALLRRVRETLLGNAHTAKMKRPILLIACVYHHYSSARSVPDFLFGKKIACNDNLRSLRSRGAAQRSVNAAAFPSFYNILICLFACMYSHSPRVPASMLIPEPVPHAHEVISNNSAPAA